MYKLGIPSFLSGEVVSVICLSDNACIPFDPMNSDFVAFKLALQNGVELQDDTGTPIDGKTFLQGLL